MVHTVFGRCRQERRTAGLSRAAGAFWGVILLGAAVMPAAAQERPDALRLYNSGRYEEAVQVCLEELQAMPRNMDSYAVLTWSLLRLGRHEEALEHGRRGLEIARRDPRMVQVVGEANYHLGRNLEALRWFEEYTVMSSQGSRIDLVYYHMGEVFIRLGEYNHADIALTTAVHHSPNNARWWARLGYAREMAEDFRYASEAYDRALTLNPGLSDAERGRERVRSRLTET